MTRTGFAFLAVTIISMNNIVVGQNRPLNAAVEIQKQKLQVLAGMDGIWRGSMWTTTPDGSRIELTQTERVGPMLDGAVKVVEGRGYNDDGEVVFNALGVISWDIKKGRYNMHSHARGRQGDHELEMTEDGFKWKISFGPGIILYTATIKDGKWHETGERIIGGRPTVRFLEMNLERVSETDWPAGDAVPPK